MGMRMFKLNRRQQDSSTFIADHILAFYMILRDNFGKSFCREQILFAAGLMDVFVYLEKGLLTPKEIARAVLLAKRGECALNGKKIAHVKGSVHESASGYAPDEQELLLNFIMQIECEIMAVERKTIDEKSILRFINSRKELLRESVQRGLSEGKEHKFYEPLSEQAKIWFLEENMNKVVSDL